MRRLARLDLVLAGQHLASSVSFTSKPGSTMSPKAPGFLLQLLEDFQCQVQQDTSTSLARIFHDWPEIQTVFLR